jgi:hypothetical protein
MVMTGVMWATCYAKKTRPTSKKHLNGVGAKLPHMAKRSKRDHFWCKHFCDLGQCFCVVHDGDDVGYMLCKENTANVEERIARHRCKVARYSQRNDSETSKTSTPQRRKKGRSTGPEGGAGTQGRTQDTTMAGRRFFILYKRRDPTPKKGSRKTHKRKLTTEHTNTHTHTHTQKHKATTQPEIERTARHGKKNNPRRTRERNRQAGNASHVKGGKRIEREARAAACETVAHEGRRKTTGRRSPRALQGRGGATRGAGK